MAGDWIKMRTDLYRDPKVCMIADLLYAADSELSRYVNQNMQRNMSVTRNVMRNVTVGALVSVWGVLRHRGKRVGDDLVVNGCLVSVVDDISELPGFGSALQSVGWMVSTDSGLLLPRFFEEFNVDPGEDLKKKNADRQRRYREKHKEESNELRNVTVASKSNAREEKRREEVNKTPKPPAGASSPAIEFKTFIDRCKASSEKPISDYKPLFDYTDRVGLPAEFVQLAWFEFGRIFGEGGVKESRRQKDWRKTFRNYVEKGYLKLWWLNGETFELTTAGKQAQRANAERLAA